MKQSIGNSVMVFLHVRGTRVAWQHLATENEALNIVMRGLSKNDWKSNPLQSCEAWQCHGTHCTTEAASGKKYHMCIWKYGTFGKEISMYSQEAGSSGK